MFQLARNEREREARASDIALVSWIVTTTPRVILDRPNWNYICTGRLPFANESDFGCRIVNIIVNSSGKRTTTDHLSQEHSRKYYSRHETRWSSKRCSSRDAERALDGDRREKLGQRRHGRSYRLWCTVERYVGISWLIVLLLRVFYIYIYFLWVKLIVVILLYIYIFFFNSMVVPRNVTLAWWVAGSCEIHISIIFERRNEDYWRNRIIYYWCDF